MANLLYDTLFGRYLGQSSVFLHLPDGSTLTHDAFLQMAARFAHVLSANGLETGDRLAAQIDKSPEALAVYAACAQAGVIFLPLNNGYTENELDYFIKNSGAKLVLVTDAKSENLIPIANAHGAKVQTLNSDGTGSFAREAALQPGTFETVARAPDDLAAFLYTSGTTGRSKGAMLTQANLISNAETLAKYWRFTDEDVLLHALPIFHTHGLFVACNVTLIAGGSMIFLPKLDIKQLIRFMPQATTMMGVPTFYTRLLDDEQFTAEITSHMRLFISGSAPLLAETHIRFEERTGHRILERYGLTETNMNTSNPYDGERRAGTVGFPLPNIELRVVDPETGDELPKGEIGNLEVRGPNVFIGYWKMPEKTAEDIAEDGFFNTGDKGKIDSDGYVSIVGRAKDVVITGGLNVYPKEIELFIDDLPGVKESAVIGVPHADFGEAVVAVVVPDSSQQLGEDEIIAHAKAELANFKVPKRVMFVDELPRNTMAKVQKNILRDTYDSLFA